jgi:organic hydroperoxide reductase OsmC/OhrA
MGSHTATVTWQRKANEAFIDNKYSRGHLWEFDGGAQVQASASPHIVRFPYSIAANVDPEEAYIAALSSCHMLFFLSLTASAGFVVDDYADHAVGRMAKNEAGRTVVTEIVLSPVVRYKGSSPSREKEEHLHHEAHEACFLANSVKTKITVQLSETALA